MNFLTWGYPIEKREIKQSLTRRKAGQTSELSARASISQRKLLQRCKDAVTSQRASLEIDAYHRTIEAKD